MPSLLIHVLFFLSFLTCDGRLLSVDHNIGRKNVHSSSLRHSSKGVEEVRDTSATVQPEATRLMAEEPGSERKGPAAAAGEGALWKTKEDPDTIGMAEDLEASEEVVDGTKGAASGVVQAESLGTVSWRVPRHTHKVHPGFNIDYDAPRTHPPSHN